MTLVCPACDTDTFHIVDSVEFGRDASWDENTVQRARCATCRARFICRYQERRTMNPDRGDTTEHTTFPVGPVIWHLLGLALEAPIRKISRPWRTAWVRRLLKSCRSTGLTRPIRYTGQ